MVLNFFARVIYCCCSLDQKKTAGDLFKRDDCHMTSQHFEQRNEYRNTRYIAKITGKIRPPTEDCLAILSLSQKYSKTGSPHQTS